eukprot:scaffold4341_cov161-Amphora_coffeaeformis.AAC.7
MGDCNLRLYISELLWEKVDPKNDRKGQIHSVRLASDATLADMLELTVEILGSKPSIGKVLQDYHAKLWDCTYHPPKDITQSTLEQFPGKSGPKSLTLFDAGWYPSGLFTLTCPDEGAPKRAAANYDDVQYNTLSSADETKAIGTVQLKHHSGPVLPSQLLQSVSSRFDGIDAPDTDTQQARLLRHETTAQTQVREAKRQEKLQERIRKLDEKLASSKGGGVASQVQRMLVKSRAVGRPNLGEQDRVYLRVVLDKGDETIQEDFRYFSRQDVVGRALSTFPHVQEQHMELLVRNAGEEYRRLPNLLRFHEAVDAGYMASFDRVVVRVYDPTEEEPTISVTMDSPSTPATGAEATAISSAANNSITDMSLTTEEPTDTVIDKESPKDPGDFFADEILVAALAAMESKNKKSKAAKSSAAVSKVRQMQMKSKAKGDAKRVQMPDRFFLEVVLAQRSNDSTAVTISSPPAPYFLANSDPLHRLVKDGWVKVPLASAQFVIPPQEGGIKFRRVADPSESVQSISSAGILSSFDRIIVYY